MPEITLAAFTETFPHLAIIAKDANQQRMEVCRLLGAGGYGAVFEARAPGEVDCVLKIAGIEFAGARTIHTGEMGPYRDAVPGSLFTITGPSPTGPLYPSAPVSVEQACSLLEEAWQRQQQVNGDIPLPRLFALFHLGGRPAVLLERLRGPSLTSLLAETPKKAQAVLPAVVQALLQLHNTFGKHGDLKPDHIFVETDRVVFIDPLPENDQWVGSLGYTVPSPGIERDGGLLRDLGSLAAILAECWGGNVGWDEGFVRCLANLHNGRFRCRGFQLSQGLDRMREGTRAVPSPVRSWILEIGQEIFRDPFRGAAEQPVGPAWCRERLGWLASALK